jgi:cholera toxin transcriptional activator
MNQKHQRTQLLFESFELDTWTGELRKNDSRLRLQDQPVRLLALLATRAGEVVLREEIQRELRPDGQFVEFDHAINTAIKKIREALGDDADKHQLIETLPRKGYRFLASLEAVSLEAGEPESMTVDDAQGDGAESALSAEFVLDRGLAWFLFVLIHVGYLTLYCTAHYYWDSLDTVLRVFEPLPVGLTLPTVVVTAMYGIAVRLYMLSSIALAHRAAGVQFRRLFPVVLVIDALWAASPLLAASGITVGVALIGVAGMAYTPFLKRTLMRRLYPTQVPEI